VSSNDVPGGEAVLDYGCGNRPYEQLLRTKYRIYRGADLPGNPDADITLAVGQPIPVPDESFDGVVSTQVLEHVDDPRRYLREAWRVLRPRGVLLLSTHGVWQYHPDPTDFWRWTLDGLRRELAMAGFASIREEGVLSAVTSAAQLWQDATLERLPRPLRGLYCVVLQSFISWVESRHPHGAHPDAAIYILVATRQPSPPG
jgi:SAM-dependent methyltransferase